MSHLYRHIRESLRKTFKMRKYPTADRNAHPMRLLAQGLPYLFAPGGYSLPPLSVFIHVNSACNLKCKMCDAGQNVPDSMFFKNLKGGMKGDLPLADFKRIIDKIAPFRPFVGIPATEPLLYADIAGAVEYVAKDKGLRLSVATNGTLLEQQVDDLMRAGLTKLVVSLDGPEEVHDQIRGVKGTYQRVLAGLRALQEARLKRGDGLPLVYLNYVISEDNYDAIEEFVDKTPLELADQVDLRVMFFCTEEVAADHNRLYGGSYDATTACLAGGLNPDKVDAKVAFRQVESAIQRTKGKCHFFFNHDQEGLHRYYHQPEVFLDGSNCVFPWYTMQINSDGGVIPPQRCYHQIFGNILEQDFDEIWLGEPMRRFRRDLRRVGRFPACSRCEGVNF